MERPLRLIFAGIVAGLILFTVASISYNLGGKISDPSISHLFREAVSMKWFHKLLLINIGSGIIMAIFYALMSNGLPGGTIAKGLAWGLVVWVIMVNQPLITSLVAGKFSPNLLLTWLAQGCASYCAAGICIALIYKN